MKPLILPWPPAALRPNARVDRRDATSTRKSYKEACAWLARAAGRPNLNGATLALSIIFHPPTAHARDLDNCLAAAKYALDGIAIGWGINDQAFQPITIDWGDQVAEGSIEVRL